MNNVIELLNRAIETKNLEYVREALNFLRSEDLNDDCKAFKNITNSMLNTYIAKNHDYGNSFDQSLDKFGLVAAVVRIGDKMNRIESLITKEAKVKDESIKDTLLDMANYAIMTTMWMDKRKIKKDAKITNPFND